MKFFGGDVADFGGDLVANYPILPHFLPHTVFSMTLLLLLLLLLLLSEHLYTMLSLKQKSLMCSMR